jgi:CheY-like chemotaxis protein
VLLEHHPHQLPRVLVILDVDDLDRPIVHVGVSGAEGCAFRPEIPGGPSPRSRVTEVMELRAVWPAVERVASSPSAMTHLLRSAGSPRVLVFEPHADTQDLLVRALEQRGARVLVAPTRAHAPGFVRAEAVEVCLIAVDLASDGFALAAELRRDGGADLRLIATTVYRRARARALASGFDAVLLKPFALNSLFAAIAGVG